MEWKVAIYQYHDLRQMLFDVTARQPNLTTEQQTLIQNAVVQLKTIDERVSEAEQTGGAPEIESSDEDTLLDVQSMLYSLASELKQKIEVGGD